MSVFTHRSIYVYIAIIEGTFASLVPTVLDVLANIIWYIKIVWIWWRHNIIASYNNIHFHWKYQCGIAVSNYEDGVN